MAELHPDPETLRRYVHGALGREPRRAVEVHLAGCAACRDAVDALPVPAGPVRWEGHRFAARRLDREREEERAESLGGVLGALGPIIAAVSRGELAGLLGADQLRRRAMIRDEPRFWSLTLCELLEARCRAAWLDDPEEAVESAKLAVLIAERAAAAGGGERAEGSRAMALMHLGSACRVAAEQRAALPERTVAETAEAAEAAGEVPAGVLASWEAEQALWELRDAFLARGMGFDAALVCLELAAAFLRDGREDDLRRMAAESIPAFEAHGADRLVTDTLRALLDAEVRAGRPLSLDMLRKMSLFLQEARNDPRRTP
jgi:hypothetical protein